MSEERTNPFKKIEGAEKLSPEVKKKVMASVGLARLVGDFTELFTTKLAATAGNMMDVKGSKNKVTKKSDLTDDAQSKE